jgi:uncharacterized protein (DUF983 family)
LLFLPSDTFGLNQAEMPNKNLATAIIECKCPKCRTGQIFPFSAFNLTKFNRMNERCPNCDVRLEPEPGFYQGAMYVSYGFTVAFIVIIGVLLYYLANDPNEWIYVGTVIGVMILLAPLNYRYSRVIYLYSFGGLKYNPALSK